MFRNSLTLTLALAALVSPAAWAQPPDMAVFPGDERPHRDRLQGRHLERIAEYLELSEAQAIQWQEIIDQHVESGRTRWQEIDALHSEFSELADTPDPELESLGRIALNIHRKRETGRAAREQMLAELEEPLTPEQMQKFEALKAARDVAGPGFGRRGRGSRRDLPRPD